jgi:hypothetical protein
MSSSGGGGTKLLYRAGVSGRETRAN